MKKVSLIGLPLFFSSIFITAFYKTSGKNESYNKAGSLTASSIEIGGGSAGANLTCVMTAGNIGQGCNVTLNSGTTLNDDSSDREEDSTIAFFDVDDQ